MGTFLVFFIPQKCGDHACTSLELVLHKNSIIDRSIQGINAFSEKELNDKYINDDEVIYFDGMQYAFQNVAWAHNEFPLVFKKIGEKNGS